MRLHKNNYSYGFALVEIMVSCAILSAVTIALLSYAQKGLEFSNLSLRQTQAVYLLEEGAEAIKTFRDNDWANISGLHLDTNYYFVHDGATGIWYLNQTPSTLNGIFTRTVVISAVNRDSNDDITQSGGTLDTGTKKVTITISWSNAAGDTNTRTVSFYLMDIFT